MGGVLRLSAPLAAASCLVVTRLGFAAEPPPVESPEGRGPDGQRVTTYTKAWTDDYFNDHKEVYRAYTKTLKDENGEEVAVEIRHGKASDFYKNGNKRW